MCVFIGTLPEQDGISTTITETLIRADVPHAKKKHRRMRSISDPCVDTGECLSVRVCLIEISFICLLLLLMPVNVDVIFMLVFLFSWHVCCLVFPCLGFPVSSFIVETRTRCKHHIKRDLSLR